MTGFEYGNARLRARRSHLLRMETYRGMLRGRTVDAMLGMLASTAYRPDVEAALPRYRDLRRLDEVVRRHLSRTLRALLRFYDGGEARRCAALLVGRWDLFNLRTILRGKARLVPADELEPLLVPAGGLDRATLVELARVPGVRALVDLMVAWQVPSRAWALALWRALPRYERAADVGVLEHALDRGWARHVDAELATLPRHGDVARALRGEIDRRNLMLALRLREARLVEGAPVERVPPRERYLPGGRLREAALDDAAHGTDRAAARARLRPVAGSWGAALDGWAADGDLTRLTDALDAAATRDSVALFTRGDPLGAAVPVAFVAAKENEAQNLRRIGRALVHGVPRAEAEQELVAAW